MTSFESHYHSVSLGVNKGKEDRAMNVELITKADLEQFKRELFEELRSRGSKSMSEQPKWLKSYQVKNMLRISPGTLQNLRLNGSIAFTKIGGILYYKYEDIIKLLDGK